MKKLCLAFTVCLAVLMLSAKANAAPAILEVGGQNLWEAAKAELIEGTTYVSLRALAQELLPESEVAWVAGCAVVQAKDLRIEARPGDTYMIANDRAFYVPKGIRLIDGTVLVPVRVIAQSLGAEVIWSASTGTKVISGTGKPAPVPYTSDELEWMSRIISAESKGEPLEGKLAVGTVILNRVASGVFPNTIYGVIFDRHWGVQFQPTANGTIYDEPTQESVLAAKMVLEGARVARDSLYFLAPNLTENHWIMENRDYVMTIGSHWFYR